MSNILTDWLKENEPQPSLAIYLKGFEAYASGGVLEDNPYDLMDGRYIDWNNGYLEGEYLAKSHAR